jgi:Tol biopolymer transport system component/DNA-binding winged helix-turn-helix (wHTH) protein
VVDHKDRSYQFGPYRLIPAERLLLRDGEPVPLAPKAFDTLVALVNRAGRLATKEDLLQEVWPDAFVEESNLTQNVFALRRALGEPATGKPYIETVPKRGYRFTADVTTIEAAGAAPAAPPAHSVPPPAPSRVPVIAIVIVGIAALAGVGTLIMKARGTPAPVASFQTMKMVRLTTSGNLFNVAISPDGKYVAHAAREGGQQSLWVRQTATQSPVQIVAPSNVSYVGLTFSPDGSYLYYNVLSDGGSRRTLFQIPALGGTPKKVIENLRGGAVAVSPDGTRLAFIRVARGQESALMIANADGSGERKLLSVAADDLDAPAWSPDGTRIAYTIVSATSNDSTILEANVADGSTRPVTSRRWLRIIKLAWTSDGSKLLLLATQGESFAYQVWQLSYPDDTVERLTNDLNSYGSMSFAAEADVLAVVVAESEANIWVVPDNDASRARRVTNGGGRTDVPTGWTPDGRIVYHSNVGGTYDIWITGADGREPQQLTRNARVNQGPVVSPDGRSIVFLSDRSGSPHLWRMNLDGSDQRQLTNGEGEQNPRFSPDGRWIVYRTWSTMTLWRIPAEGGEAVRLAEPFSFSPSVSPDGQWLAYLHQDQNAPLQIVVAPFAGGPPVKTFPFVTGAPLQRFIRWTHDGRAIAFIDTAGDVSNVYAQPLEGGERVALTAFKDGRLFGFAWSEDGRQLAVSRGTLSSDVVLIKDFR